MKRRHIILILVFLALIGGIAWLVRPAQEPQYQGKNLSDWLEPWTGMGVISNGAMAEVVLAVGTSAIPFYLDCLNTKDSPLRDKAINLLHKQSLIRFRCYTGVERRTMGWAGFVCLGPEAAPAMPALLRILAETNSPGMQWIVIRILGSIGPAAVPALLRILADNHNPGRQAIAAQSLESIGPAAEAAVPALIQNLNAAGTNGFLGRASINALAQIHRQPALVVAVLRQQLQSKGPNHQQTYWIDAMAALGEFGPEAKTAIPDLLPFLNDSSEYIRSAATNALLKIDPAAAAEAGVK